MELSEMEEDIEEMADNSEKREKFVEDVKKSLVKTLKICLTPKEVEKIKREFEKNVRHQEDLNQCSGDIKDVPSLIGEIVTTKVQKSSPSPESSSSSKTDDGFVKPKFMRVNQDNPFPFPAPEQKRPKHVSKAVATFEQSFTRTKHMEKVEKNLKRQKRKAERADKNKKYPGFGEVFDPLSHKMKKKAEKKLEQEIRRMNRVSLLKKANVSNEEKDLINELIQVAESSVSNSAASLAAEEDLLNQSVVEMASSKTHQQNKQSDPVKTDSHFLQNIVSHTSTSTPIIQNDINFPCDSIKEKTQSPSQEQEPAVRTYGYYHEMDTLNEFEFQNEAISSQNFLDDLDTLLEM